MRVITKDIQITIDGSPAGFRLTKLDAFSGVTLLRLLMRLEERKQNPSLETVVNDLTKQLQER